MLVNKPNYLCVLHKFGLCQGRDEPPTSVVISHVVLSKHPDDGLTPVDITPRFICEQQKVIPLRINYSEWHRKSHFWISAERFPVRCTFTFKRWTRSDCCLLARCDFRACVIYDNVVVECRRERASFRSNCTRWIRLWVDFLRDSIVFRLAWILNRLPHHTKPSSCVCFGCAVNVSKCYSKRNITTTTTTTTKRTTKFHTALLKFTFHCLYIRRSRLSRHWMFALNLI